MSDAGRSEMTLVRIAWGAVLFTVVLGIVLRLSLAGTIALPLSFSFARHAHSHMGYFGVLLPLVWLAWRDAGGQVLSRALLVAYALAAAVASIGFLFVGYQLVTIAASTALGALWVASAWRARALWRGPDPWLRMGPAGVALACLWVPPIGVITPRNPALGVAIAHSFLAFLLFVVIVPAALSRVRAPRALAWPWISSWLVLGALAAVDLGAFPHAFLGGALALYGAGLAFAAPRAEGSPVVRVALAVTGLGCVLVGARVLPLSHANAMAGVHASVLSAALAALAPLRSRVDSAMLVGSGLLMAAVLAAGDVGLSPSIAHGAAAFFGFTALVPLARMRPRAAVVSGSPPE